MTLIIEAPPTAGAVLEPDQRAAAHNGASTGWASTAVRAHGLLSQTTTDEDLDELLNAAPPFVPAIVLPAFLFG